MYLANLEVKSKAPNGVSFNVKGKSTHEGHTGGQVNYPSKPSPSSDIYVHWANLLINLRLKPSIRMHPLVHFFRIYTLLFAPNSTAQISSILR